MENRSKAGVVCICFLLSLVCFAFEETVTFCLPDAMLLRALCKLIIGAVILYALVLGMRGAYGAVDRLFAAAMAAYAAADVSINVSPVLGMACFMVGHVVLSARQIRVYRPKAGWYLVWAVVSVAIGAAAWKIVAGTDITIPLLPIVVYIAALLAMLVFSCSGPWPQWAGAVIFVLSDLLLVRNFLTETTPLSHVISLGVYYAALWLWAAAPQAQRRFPIQKGR